jgi:hypothetical protein
MRTGHFRAGSNFAWVSPPGKNRAHRIVRRGQPQVGQLTKNVDTLRLHASFLACFAKGSRNVACICGFNNSARKRWLAPVSAEVSCSFSEQNIWAITE